MTAGAKKVGNAPALYKKDAALFPDKDCED